LRFMFEVLENLRHADQHRDSILVNEVDDLARMNFSCESSRAFQKQRHEDSKRLAEHVTERKQIENANRLKWSSPLFVLRDLFLKRPEIRADVSMSMNNAFRFSSCSGGVHDLYDVIWTYCAWSKGIDGLPTGNGVQLRTVEHRLRSCFGTNV